MDFIVSCKDFRIYNITDSSIKEKYVHHDSPKAVSMNNFDGETLGVLYNDDTLRVYSMSGEIKCTMALKPNSNCFSFFKSDRVVVGDSLGDIYLYNISDNECQSSLVATQNMNDGILSINVSPGNMLIYCRHKSGKMSRYNVQNDESHSFKFKQTVSAFDVSRWAYQATLLGCDNGIVSRYDCEKERCTSLWEHHKSNATGVAFSLHNKLVALSVSKDRTAALLAFDTSGIIKTFPLRNIPTSCAFNEDNLFAVGDEAGLVSIFDIRMAKLIQQLKTKGNVSFVGFNNKDEQFDRNDISFKSRLFKEKQNITDSSSGNSLFSADDSLDMKEIDNHSFDLSRFSSFPSSISTTSVDTKKPKTVKFEVNITPKTKLSIPVSTTVATKENQLNISPTMPVLENTTAIRKIISEELRKELSLFEFRIKNDLIFGVIDQLCITERNIISPLQDLFQDNQTLMEENERLRQELRKYKYNV